MFRQAVICKLALPISQLGPTQHHVWNKSNRTKRPVETIEEIMDGAKNEGYDTQSSKLRY